MIRRVLVAAIATMVALSSTASASGGGSVDNVAPLLESFTNALGPTANAGATDVFTGVAFDRNGEADLKQIRINITAGGNLSFVHNLTLEDLRRATKPTEAVAGWKAWNPVPDDGRVEYEFAHAYAATGAHRVEATALDEDAAAAPKNVSVTVQNPPAVGGGPVPSPTSSVTMTTAPAPSVAPPVVAAVTASDSLLPLELTLGKELSAPEGPAPATDPPTSDAARLLPWFVIAVAFAIVVATTRPDKRVRAILTKKQVVEKTAETPNLLERTLFSLEPTDADVDAAEMWDALQSTPTDPIETEPERALEIGDLQAEDRFGPKAPTATPKKPS